MTTTMLFDSVGHVDDEALDLYCGARLPPDEEDPVRQHLRVCPECWERVEREAYFRRSLEENRDLFDVPAARASEKRDSGGSLDLLFGWRPAAVLAALVLAVVLLPRLTSVGSAPPADVTLAALRGEDRIQAPAGHPLRLRLELDGLTDHASLTVQVVTRTGQPVASGVPTLEANAARFRLDQPLAAGQYWVRLVRDGEPVREYSLRVK